MSVVSVFGYSICLMLLLVDLWFVVFDVAYNVLIVLITFRTAVLLEFGLIVLVVLMICLFGVYGLGFMFSSFGFVCCIGWIGLVCDFLGLVLVISM